MGHSMGTGEVTRYLGTHGSERIDKAVLISPIPPYFVGSRGFLDNSYNMDVYAGTLVSEQAFQASFSIAAAASPIAAVACVPGLEQRFPGRCGQVRCACPGDQGDADRVLPIDLPGGRWVARSTAGPLRPRSRGAERAHPDQPSSFSPQPLGRRLCCQLEC